MLCKRNTKNTPLHPGLMHSHVPMNVVTYIAKKGGRINVLLSCILQNLAFVKWVQHQQDLHILEVTKTTINIQFVLNDEMHHFFSPLLGDHNIKTQLTKETRTNVKKAFGGHASKFVH